MHAYILLVFALRPLSSAYFYIRIVQEEQHVEGSFGDSIDSTFSHAKALRGHDMMSLWRDGDVTTTPTHNPTLISG